MHEGKNTRQVLVIGGACGDMLLGVPRMPLSGEDVEAKDNGLQIGGCAFNVARVLTRLGASVLNGMPVGNGNWGNAVETAMQALHLPVLMRHPDMDNGWCLALAQQYAARSGLTLICRLDKEGAWICPPDSAPEAVAPYPVTVVDSIGAGDAHCGGLLAGLSAGWSLTESVDLANRVAACMVAVQGSSQPPDWNTLHEYFPDAPPLPAFLTR
ncbi:MAG: PfkB family carbohydrate kinase [Symbiopectobacterium sp.]|uniref:PfkB family carbohydrate kinase n=1 Tax=Symbiopectobacterium sp. TaxID=2952789 RepID=UPI0039E8B246